MDGQKVLGIGVPWLLAIVTVVMWLVIVGMMWSRIDTAGDAAWNRMLSIMTALQALAFAAAGALWGVKVQEKETDKAKAGEAEANKGKDKAVTVAQEGKRLSSMILDHIQGDAGKLGVRKQDAASVPSDVIAQARIVRDAPLP